MSTATTTETATATIQDVQPSQLTVQYRVLDSEDIHTPSALLFRVPGLDVWFNQYLILNTKAELIQLANHITVHRPISKLFNKDQLITLISTKLELNIPADIRKYARGPNYIYYRFEDIQQTYIRLNEQTDTGFRYAIKSRGQTEYEIINYEYPFASGISSLVNMHKLCKALGLMSIQMAKKLKFEELTNLLNEKIMLEDQGS